MTMKLCWWLAIWRQLLCGKNKQYTETVSIQLIELQVLFIEPSVSDDTKMYFIVLGDA